MRPPEPPGPKKGGLRCFEVPVVSFLDCLGIAGSVRHAAMERDGAPFFTAGNVRGAKPESGIEEFKFMYPEGRVSVKVRQPGGYPGGPSSAPDPVLAGLFSGSDGSGVDKEETVQYNCCAWGVRQDQFRGSSGGRDRSNPRKRGEDPSRGASRLRVGRLQAFTGLVLRFCDRKSSPPPRRLS